MNQPVNTILSNQNLAVAVHNYELEERLRALRGSGGGSGGSSDNTTNISNQQVWFIGGDSLARGTSTVFDDGAEPDYAQSVYEYTGGSIVEITTGDLAAAQIGSMWPKWGDMYYKATGKKPIFVNKAVGGATFYPYASVGTNNWDTGVNYTNAKTDWDAALIAASVTKPKGIIFILGVNDARNASYNQSLTSGAIDRLVGKLQTDYSGVPIYFINVGRQESGIDTTNLLSLRPLIDALPGRFPGVKVPDSLRNYTDPTLNGIDTDQLHQNQFGNEWSSTNFFKKMFDAGYIENNPISRTYDSTDTTLFARFPNALTTYEKNKLHDFNQFITRKGYTSGTTLPDAFYFALLKDETNARTDWRRSGKSATGGSWSATRGFYTNGTSDFIDWQYIPSTDKVQLGNATVEVASMINNVSASAGTLFGSIGSTPHSIRARKAATGIEFAVNSQTLTLNTGNLVNNNVYYAAEKTSVGIQSARINANAVNGAITFTGVPDKTLYAGANNNNGSAEDFLQVDFYFLIAGGSPIGGNMYRKYRQLAIDFLVGV